VHVLLLLGVVCAQEPLRSVERGAYAMNAQMTMVAANSSM